jgi:hypothetical protein
MSATFGWASPSSGDIETRVEARDIVDWIEGNLLLVEGGAPLAVGSA